MQADMPVTPAAVQEVASSPPAPPPAPVRQPAPVRAILRMLGFDPDATRGGRRKRPFDGFLVTDAQGGPLRFYTVKQMRTLERDASLYREFQQHLAREQTEEAVLPGAVSEAPPGAAVAP